MKNPLIANIDIRFPVWFLLAILALAAVVDLWLWPDHPWWLFWVIGTVAGFLLAWWRDRSAA